MAKRVKRKVAYPDPMTNGGYVITDEPRSNIGDILLGLTYLLAFGMVTYFVGGGLLSWVTSGKAW